MADGAARRERPVVMDRAFGRVAPKAETQRLGGLEDDERIDGAARTGSDGGDERRVRKRVFAEPRVRPRLGAEQGRANGLELPAASSGSEASAIAMTWASHQGIRSTRSG